MSENTEKEQVVAEVAPEATVVVEIPAPVVEEALKVEEAPAKEEKPKAKKEEKTKVEETVALFSKGNIHWAEVGRLLTGYNIVSKADSEKWLTKFKSVRLATPEEIATKAKN